MVLWGGGVLAVVAVLIVALLACLPLFRRQSSAEQASSGEKPHAEIPHVPPPVDPPPTTPDPPPADLAEEITNGIGMRLKLIQPGKFLMGSPKDEEGRYGDEWPQHEVEMTRPFYLGRTR